MPTPQFQLPLPEIKSFCHRWKVQEFCLFGSALRDDFHPDSDIDIMLDFADGATWTLFDQVNMQQELREIFSREVDLVTRRGVESSHNINRRESILSSSRVVYAA